LAFFAVMGYDNKRLKQTSTRHRQMVYRIYFAKVLFNIWLLY
jgi:hypothetical protein